jgi:hypothetical protein
MYLPIKVVCTRFIYYVRFFFLKFDSLKAYLLWLTLHSSTRGTVEQDTDALRANVWFSLWMQCN